MRRLPNNIVWLFPLLIAFTGFGLVSWHFMCVRVCVLERAKANRQKGKKKKRMYICVHNCHRHSIVCRSHWISTLHQHSWNWVGGELVNVCEARIPRSSYLVFHSCVGFVDKLNLVHVISFQFVLLFFFFPLRSGLVHRVRFSNSGTGEKYALSQSHFVWHRFQYSKRRFDFALRTLWIVSFFSVVLCQLFLAKIANAKWWRENTALVKRMKN